MSIEKTTTQAPVPEPAAGRPLAVRFVHRFEDVIAVSALALMVLLPVSEIVGRRLIDQGVPGSVGFVQHLTLWVAFLGAMITARERRHLALATANFLPASLAGAASLVASAVGTSVAAVLAWTSVTFVRFESASLAALGFGIPVWVAQTVIPLGFGVIAVRMWWQSGSVPAGEAREGAAPVFRQLPAAQAWMRRALVLGILGLVWAMQYVPEEAAGAWRWPLVSAVIVATILGAPIFVALGGLAVALFFSDPIGAGPISVIPAEAYRIVSSDVLPTIPLFTLAGSLLAQGGTPDRLVRLFRALAGWLPGGTAVAAVLVCAFFTTFTGASGVTILALGGLLLPVLVADVYSERFALGTVTASGSIGLLFPPSLPVILYGISAQVPINELFIGCIVPGLVLVTLVSAYCVRTGVRGGAAWKRPQPGEVVVALWQAKWEVMLPVVVFVSLFGGFATIVEAAAITALYALLIKTVVYRDVTVFGGLPVVLRDTVVLVGGVLIILGCALGLTNYLIIAEVPAKGAEWVRQAIESRWIFLLVLNGFLLVVGCLMDVFSAIFVVVPLILPIAAAFGVDPLHLGAIFLINLELGYLTPPVGMNLFLSSYRFNKPILEVARAILPFMAVQAVGVLLVTYLPALSVGVARWWAGG